MFYLTLYQHTGPADQGSEFGGGPDGVGQNGRDNAEVFDTFPYIQKQVKEAFISSAIYIF